MPIKCPKGTSQQFRFKKTNNGAVRLGGCAKDGKFVNIVEVMPYERTRAGKLQKVTGHKRKK